jgi:hypothetical protein
MELLNSGKPEILEVTTLCYMAAFMTPRCDGPFSKISCSHILASRLLPALSTWPPRVPRLLAIDPSLCIHQVATARVGELLVWGLVPSRL